MRPAVPRRGARPKRRAALAHDTRDVASADADILEQLVTQPFERGAGAANRNLAREREYHPGARGEERSDWTRPHGCGRNDGSKCGVE